MFWSGNLIFVKELNYLLKSENVTLSQVLEADDILQECKADNKGLIQFLTKPEILAELITLITEEPPQNVELASQYRHASIACEVLTSHLSMLSDRLSLDTVQMNRLCDFINKEPPLNPLLASYFSKTVEMLLERSPKQDWYLYHIVCLRVLDFFKSRRDFLPNLLRHLATSAIADTFKYFIRLDDLFNKIVMEWLEEHQFLECLIQIICGTYVPEPIRPSAEVAARVVEPACAPALLDATNANLPPAALATDSQGPAPDTLDAHSNQHSEKADKEHNEKPELNHKDEARLKAEDTEVNNSHEVTIKEESASAVGAVGAGAGVSSSSLTSSVSMGEAEAEAAAGRMRAVAAANAAALLCDLILNGCAGDGCTTRLRTVWAVVSTLQSGGWVRALLQGMFTCGPRERAHALVHGTQVLLALLSTDPILAGQCAAERSSVELAVAPHLPLLHQALLQDPDLPSSCCGNAVRGAECEAEAETGARRRRVGAARVHVAALLAQLALSEVEDVPSTMITLGTPGVLVELFLSHADNNFLHAQVHALVKHALANRAYRTQYANHLFVECDLLTRFMDVYEENENKKAGEARAGYMGHVVATLRTCARALGEQDAALRQALRLPAALLARFDSFLEHTLRPVLLQHDTPLGGYYPSENIYEAENMADSMEASYEFNDMSGGALDELGELADDVNIDNVAEVGAEMDETGEGGGGVGGEDQMARNNFLELANQFLANQFLANQRFDDDMWEDSPQADDDLGVGAPSLHDVRDVLAAVSPWESAEAEAGSEQAGAGEGWAQFGAHLPPVDPFAPQATPASCDVTTDNEPPPAPAPAQPHQRFDASDFNSFWSCTEGDANESRSQDMDIERSMENLRLEGGLEAADAALAGRLLTALAGVPPDGQGNILHDNTPPEPSPAPPAPAPSHTPPSPPPSPPPVPSDTDNSSER